MSLSRRQQRTLCRIERDLADSDPRLKEYFLLFSNGFRGCEMPRVERLPGWPSRLWRGRGVTERMVAWCAGDWNNL